MNSNTTPLDVLDSIDNVLENIDKIETIFEVLDREFFENRTTPDLITLLKLDLTGSRPMTEREHVSHAWMVEYGSIRNMLQIVQDYIATSDKLLRAVK